LLLFLLLELGFYLLGRVFGELAFAFELFSVIFCVRERGELLLGELLCSLLVLGAALFSFLGFLEALFFRLFLLSLFFGTASLCIRVRLCYGARSITKLVGGGRLLGRRLCRYRGLFYNAGLLGTRIINTRIKSASGFFCYRLLRSVASLATSIQSISRSGQAGIIAL
jgi:hypothetical protein